MEYTVTDALTGELISLGRDDIRRAIENWRYPENADFLAIIIE